MTKRLTRPALLIFAALLAAAVFWVDTSLGLNFKIPVVYLAVLAIVSAAGSETMVIRAAQLCLLLIVITWSIDNLPQPSVSSLMRGLFACVALGLTAALLVGRKRLEATQRELERSRAEVEHFANSVPFVLWRSNPQGEIEYLNESWTTVTGLDRISVLSNARYNEVVHPDDIDLLNEVVGNAVATRTITDLKVRIRQADGNYRWMQIYDRPAYSPITGLVERFGGLSDVHNEILAHEELERLRTELEESRQDLLNFTNSVPQILFRADRGANVDFYNERFTQVTGRDLNAVIAKQDWIEDFHPDDREEYLANLSRSFAAGEELRATFRLRYADGSYRWMSLIGRPLPLTERSEDIRYYGGVTDIHEEVTAHQKVRELNETLEQRVAERTSELLRTERRYAGLFDVSNMTFAEMDFSAAMEILDEIKAQGVTDLRSHLTAHPEVKALALGAIKTTRVNEALARLMGYDSVADLTANPPAENAEDGPEVLLRQLEMCFYGGHHIDGRTTLVGKGGRQIPIYYTVTRLPDGLHLSSHVDLSEQEQIEEMRRATQAELARANRVATVGALSASIAHELNQPIASMLMDTQSGLRFAERETPDMEGLTRILQRIEKTAQRAAGIVQRTRENIVAGRREVKGVDLCRLAAETRDLLEHDLKRADVELEIVCGSSMTSVEGDPVELQQVLVNLVSNASDAMRGQEGLRLIKIELGGDAEAVRVRVSDTGPGIAEEHLQRLFEPFFTTKASGIGMGLQICRSAVEAMGGELTVENLPEGGAAFSISLPPLQSA